MTIIILFLFLSWIHTCFYGNSRLFMYETNIFRLLFLLLLFYCYSYYYSWLVYRSHSDCTYDVDHSIELSSIIKCCPAIMIAIKCRLFSSAASRTKVSAATVLFIMQSTDYDSRNDTKIRIVAALDRTAVRAESSALPTGRSE